MDDQFANNNVYAKMGGITLKELNQLEVEVLNLLNWNLFIDNDVYYAQSKHLSTLNLHPSKSCHCPIQHLHNKLIHDSLFHDMFVLADYDWSVVK